MLPSLPEASDDSTAAGVWKQQFPLESALLLHVAPLGHPYWAMFQSPENQVRKLNALGLFASDEFWKVKYVHTHVLFIKICKINLHIKL